MGESEQPVALQVPTTHINNNILESDSHLTENTDSLSFMQTKRLMLHRKTADGQFWIFMRESLIV